MSASGTATIDFGALPGKQNTSVTVTGQTTIGSGSIVGAWISPVATADHNADEHTVEGINITAGTIVAGTGFTIYAVHDHGLGVSTDHFAWGRFTVAWAWV